MLNSFEKIVQIVYGERKKAALFVGQEHPSEEDLACFLDGQLPDIEQDLIIKHLLSCAVCAECLSTQLKIQPHLSLDVPAALLEKIKKLVNVEASVNLLEIFLQLKEKALEIIQSSGDVLLGQELVPAPVLRSRKINEFKEEVSIVKDFQRVKILAKIQNKSAKSFNLTITVTDKLSKKNEQDLRVTLIKDELELESYLHDSGSSFFENIPPGDYSVEVSRHGQREAVIDLKVKA